MYLLHLRALSTLAFICAAVASVADEPRKSPYPVMCELGPWCGELVVGPRMNASGCNLRNSRFVRIDFSGANFDDADLTDVEFIECNVQGATFRRARLENTEFQHMGPLPTDVDVTDAVINGLFVSSTGVAGMSYEQFVSTRSYKYKQLSRTQINCGGRLPNEPVYAYDLSRADLRGARLVGDCGKCDLTDAFILELRAHDLRIDVAQLTATTSYKENWLTGLDLTYGIKIRGKLDLANKKLESVHFDHDPLDASFENTRLIKCSLDRGLTREQLLATSNFRCGDFSGLTFRNWNFDGLDLSGFDLSGCRFNDCSWKDTNVADTVITGVTFDNRSQSVGWTGAQLQSTWSYQRDRLVGLRFEGSNGAGPWDFSGRTLTDVGFSGGFTNLDFRGAKLTDVWFDGGFRRADFRGATVNGLSTGYEAVLEGDFRGARLIRADFSELMFGVGTMLEGAELIDVKQ